MHPLVNAYWLLLTLDWLPQFAEKLSVVIGGKNWVYNNLVYDAYCTTAVYALLVSPTFHTPWGFCIAIVPTSIPGTFNEMSIVIIASSNESVVVNMLVRHHFS